MYTVTPVVSVGSMRAIPRLCPTLFATVSLPSEYSTEDWSLAVVSSGPGAAGRPTPFSVSDAPSAAQPNVGSALALMTSTGGGGGSGVGIVVSDEDGVSASGSVPGDGKTEA